MPKILTKVPACLHQVLILGVFFLFAAATLGMVSYAAREQRSYDLYWQKAALVKATPPNRKPIPSQQDVDIAMALYSVHLPAHLDWPVFDPELEDRGLTTGSTLQGPQAVYVGPAAFVSWAVLGSTLAHEIEVHGRQNFLQIVLQDEFFRLLGPVLTSGKALAQEAAKRGLASEDAGGAQSLQFDSYGTWKAEREAYVYELRNAERFGLSAEEVRLIKQVMDTYYPQTATHRY